MDMMPIEIAFMDENQRLVYREMYEELTMRLMRLSRRNSTILASLISSEPEDAYEWNVVQVQALYQAWQKTMVENGPTLNEVKRYQTPGCDEGSSLRVNVNASIFVELARMHFILHYEQLHQEQQDMLEMENVPTREQQKRILSMWSLNLTEAQLWTDIPLPHSIDWDKPVIKYSQKEVMDSVSMLCEILNDLGSISKPTVRCPYEDATREFMEYFRALFTRNAVFMCQAECLASTLDVPDMRVPLVDIDALQEGEEEEDEDGEEQKEGNEAEEEHERERKRLEREKNIDPDTPCMPSTDYFVWCSFYFGAILRRIHYWETIKKNVIRPRITPKENFVEGAPPGGELDRCRDLIALFAVQLGEDAFEDCYTMTCDESYAIPGDSEWFAYKYPAKQPAMGNILYEIRPELRARYWKEAHVALETVLTASKQPRPRYFMRTSHLFVINVLDAYLRQTNVMWRNAAVVAQDGIELSAWKLSRPTSPVLLQVFSRWWVYHDLFYQPCDDIYEAIVVWFRILREHYNDMLFGTSLKVVSDRILL